MKLNGRLRDVSAVFGAALLTFAIAACGSDDSTDTGDKGTGTGDGTTDKVGQPPAPSGDKASGGDPRTFAIYSLNLATDSASAQKTGYNVDGIVTDDSDTASETSCVAPSKSTPLKDGNEGIDNAFGQKLGPTIKLLISDIDTRINSFFQDGSSTVMLDITGLEDSATQTNTGLGAQLLIGADFGADKPNFTTADDWPVRPEFLKDGKTVASGSKIAFTEAYVTNGVFVGKADSVVLNLSPAGQDLTLTIHKATITFKHDGANATEGVISGVLAVDEVLDTLDKVVGSLNDGEFCETYKSNVSVIQSGADIMSDGSNKKGECNAISVGLGFTAKEIKHPTKVADPITPGAAQPSCSQR